MTTACATGSVLLGCVGLGPACHITGGPVLSGEYPARPEQCLPTGGVRGQLLHSCVMFCLLACDHPLTPIKEDASRCVLPAGYSSRGSLQSLLEILWNQPCTGHVHNHSHYAILFGRPPPPTPIPPPHSKKSTQPIVIITLIAAPFRVAFRRTAGVEET